MGQPKFKEISNKEDKPKLDKSYNKDKQAFKDNKESI